MFCRPLPLFLQSACIRQHDPAVPLVRVSLQQAPAILFVHDRTALLTLSMFGTQRKDERTGYQLTDSSALPLRCHSVGGSGGELKGIKNPLGPVQVFAVSFASTWLGVPIRFAILILPQPFFFVNSQDSLTKTKDFLPLRKV